jgi:hypothetical protein
VDKAYLPEPIFSVVKLWVVLTEPGTVIGISALQVFPMVVRVTPVIVCFFGLVVQVSFGEHASLAIRLEKPVENFL